MIGSIVRAEAILFPALTAELVIFARAVTPMTCNAENFAWTVSIPVDKPDMSTFLAAELIPSRPFADPDRFNFCLSLSSVLMVV